MRRSLLQDCPAPALSQLSVAAHLLFWTLLVLPAAPVLGQERAAAKEKWQDVFFEEPTIALPLLTAAAVRHSAQLKALEIEKSIAREDITIARKHILENIAAGGSYTYGNLASVALSDPSNPNQFKTTNSSRYAAGINFSLPLGQVTKRENLINREKLGYQRTEALRQERENGIRQQIIPLYQNVLLAKKLLTLRQEAYVTVQTNYRLAEKQFRQGQLSLAEFSETNKQLTEVAVAQETARNQYDTAFMLLEETVGAKISTLMTTP